MMKLLKMGRKTTFCQWKILIIILLLLFLDLSHCKYVNRTELMLNMNTAHQDSDKTDKNNKSICNNVKEFELQTINCLKIVTTEKWVLDVFQKYREKSLFMDILKQLICSEYKNSLQCVHIIWTTCMNDKTTLIVQDYLSRPMALQYNKLCDINIHNDTGNHGNQTQQPEKQQQSIESGKQSTSEVKKPTLVHFTEKQTYKLETEMVIPAGELENFENRDSAMLSTLQYMKNKKGDISQSVQSNNGQLSGSLKYIQTKTEGRNKLLFKSTLKYQHF